MAPRRMPRRQADEEILKRKLVEDHHRFTGPGRARARDPRPLGRAARASSSRCSRTSTSARLGEARREPPAEATISKARARRHGQGNERTTMETMGKVTGFMEYERPEEGLRAGRHAPEALQRVRRRPRRRPGRRCRRALHGLRHAVLQPRLPGQQHHPRLQRPRLSRRLGERFEVLHSTNNFPEFTGRICPAPCEAACTLNVNDDRSASRAIEHAIIDRGWARGLVVPAARAAHRQEGRGRRLGPAGLARAAARARRPRGDGVREERPHRRPAALRHPRLQDGEAPHRPAHRRRCRPRA